MDAWLGVRVLNQAPRMPTKPPPLPCPCSVRNLALIGTYWQHVTVVRFALTHGLNRGEW
jgi:hypothetical protein